MIDDRRWRIDYRDGQGRGHRATSDTRKEADKALTEIKTRIGRGEYVASKLIAKLREIAEDWFERRAIAGRELWVIGGLNSIFTCSRSWAIYVLTGSTLASSRTCAMSCARD